MRLMPLLTVAALLSPSVLPRAAAARHTVACADRSDCTAALQAALSDVSLDDIVVPAAAAQARGSDEPWAVGPLFIHRSDVRLTLEPGVQLVAKQGEFKKTDECLLQIKSDMGHGHVQNVTIVATGATFRMRKMDYLPPEYEKGEWRHTLSINGASDVTVIGGTFLEAGGDGIYVDSGGVSNFSRNVLLRQVTTDSAWRNGLSVISAINLTVVDSIFKNTNGTNPQCGIDLEPDHPTDKLQQIELRNIKLLNNTRCGFTMGPYAFATAGASNPLSVTVDGMQVTDTPGSNYSWVRGVSFYRNLY